MRNLIATALAFVFISFGLGAASAQTTLERPVVGQSAKPVEAPSQFLAILGAYQGWVPNTAGRFDAYSIRNFALRARLVYTPTLLAAARNWLFLQTEERFLGLAATYGGLVKAIFGDLYLARGIHVVFSVPYAPGVDGLYQNWYDCMSLLKQGEYTVGDRVLSWITGVQLAGNDNECRSEFKDLSAYYGVAELTSDDLNAAGFLHRRFLANEKNSKFLSAEVIRKAIGDLFDPNR